MERTWTFVTFSVFVSLLFVTSHSLITNIQEVILRSKSDCNDGQIIDYDYDDRLPTYNVSLQWERQDSCTEDQLGFFCSKTFMQRDDFDNLGTQLCIDLQGVQDDIQLMNQLLVKVYSRDFDLKKVYSITRLSPEDEPYYVCTMSNTNVLSVSISVRDSVKVCPDILEYLYHNKIRMGSVRAQPEHPITLVNMVTCSRSTTKLYSEDSNLVKIFTTGMTRFCRRELRLDLPYRHMRGCIKLVYFGERFNCEAAASLILDQKEMVELKVDRLPERDTQVCATFSYPDDLILRIDAFGKTYGSCADNFAVQVDFREIAPPDTEDDEDSGAQPQLYMAVFISLISICLICLGLTCLCCIRFRAKRMQRLQQRMGHRQGTVLNHGYQTEDGFNPDAPPYDGISWNPSQPAMLFGLPSYEEVVGGSGSGGVNPCGDSFKNELPPAYDAVFSSSSGENVEN